jgi:hypothetical protein
MESSLRKFVRLVWGSGRPVSLETKTCPGNLFVNHLHFRTYRSNRGSYHRHKEQAGMSNDATGCDPDWVDAPSEVLKLVVKALREDLNELDPQLELQCDGASLFIRFRRLQHPQLRLIRLGWLESFGDLILEINFVWHTEGSAQPFLKLDVYLWFENYSEDTEPPMLAQAINFVECYYSDSLAEDWNITPAPGRVKICPSIASHHKNLAIALREHIERLEYCCVACGSHLGRNVPYHGFRYQPSLCHSCKSDDSDPATVEQLESYVVYLKATMEQLDRNSRENNITMYNVPLQYSAEQAKALFPAHVAAAIKNVRRCRNAGQNAPVVVTFRSLHDKHMRYRAFKSSRKMLHKRSIFLDDDLTPAQRAIRQGMRPAFSELKEQGMEPFWRGERLLYITPEGMLKNTANPQAPSPPGPSPGAAHT